MSHYTEGTSISIEEGQANPPVSDETVLTLVTAV